ncbi:MAG TPA: hypothetical protein VF482_12350, partial [Trebonia sp.]
IRGYLLGIPKLTLVGGLGVLAALLIVWNFARDPFSGVSVSANPGMFWFSLALFPAGVLLYYLAAAVRRRQNVDLALAFREIPPD